MLKKVRYNGGTQSCYECSSPTNLVVGREYEVISSSVDECQTNYTLRGVNGYFNSAWFNEVNPYELSNNMHLAIAKENPMVGQNYLCYKLEFQGGKAKLVRCLTSVVKKVTRLSQRICKVETINSSYIVEVDE